ncbi:MAG: 4-hydroxy-tetrahydrodipicolinate reductase [Chlorobi bacterium]|nr:4-hydroxy-tetrahydrodipicolinate reductase [Chlorobiota bacterium]
MARSLSLALIGYGKMGKMLEKTAESRGHKIKIRIDPREPGSVQNIDVGILTDVDVCLEFTEPSSVIDNIHRLVDMGKPVVTGTTGWYQHLDEVKAFVLDKNGAVLYASNFSPGIHIFQRIIAEAMRLVNYYEQYDVSLHETHHRHKKDAPSGTAYTIAEIILDKMERKTSIFEGKPEGVIPESTLQVSSSRCGEIPGIHTVTIDSSADTITLTHIARNREGFALGAVMAAEWLYSKRGFFTMEDVFHDIESL